MSSAQGGRVNYGKKFAKKLKKYIIYAEKCIRVGIFCARRYCLRAYFCGILTIYVSCYVNVKTFFETWIYKVSAEGSLPL